MGVRSFFDGFQWFSVVFQLFFHGFSMVFNGLKGFEALDPLKATSSHLADAAMRDGELCQACPEGCVVVLLLQAGLSEPSNQPFLAVFEGRGLSEPLP